MITEHDLQEAIAECEGQRNPSANTCLKLAAFYIIKDKKFPMQSADVNEPRFYSAKKESEKMDDKAEQKAETEFRQVVSKTDYNFLISVMDEAMETIKIISPRLYFGIIEKLKSGF